MDKKKTTGRKDNMQIQKWNKYYLILTNSQNWTKLRIIIENQGIITNWGNQFKTHNHYMQNILEKLYKYTYVYFSSENLQIQLNVCSHRYSGVKTDIQIILKWKEALFNLNEYNRTCPS